MLKIDYPNIEVMIIHVDIFLILGKKWFFHFTKMVNQ